MAWRALPLLVAAGAFAAPVDIRDIRGPLAAEGLPVLSAGLLLLAGGFWLVRRRRRRASAPPPPPTPPRPDAHDLLERLIVDYRQGACPNQQIAIRLDGLLRGSLAASTGIPAQRLTSAELLTAAAAGLDAAARARLGDLLALGDRVKFAGHSPNGAEVEAALHSAARLLDGLPEGPPA